ncbi:hypothetical protein AVEN_272232-1 [Araneus ventricosus]|uniref:Uncharacterized protein n=1 Tax=Araneus ventricosus TaxID=182803 RepID=A0A4Y2FZF2_ARAVE|nr:hypothetical protein AVEN_272232-1 [Araneus ventricosus]
MWRVKSKELDHVNSCIKKIKEDVQAVKGEIEEIRGEVRMKIEELQGEVRMKIEELQGEVQGKISDIEKRPSDLEIRPNHFPASSEIIYSITTVKPLKHHGLFSRLNSTL